MRASKGGYYSTLDPHRIMETLKEARRYDEQLSTIGHVAIEQLAKGGRPVFNATIAKTVEDISPGVVLGEDPIETIFDWAKVRYKGLAQDMHKSVVLDQDTIDISSAIGYVDAHLPKHSGILVDPTFMPARNRSNFRTFLEAQDNVVSIFDTWEGYRKTRPVVSVYRALNLPTSTGLTDIGKIGLMPSLMRNLLGGTAVDLSALFYKPIGSQLMERLSQQNTSNQMLQSVSPTSDIAWLVGASPELTGSANTNTNAVYHLSLQVPDIDLIRFDDFGRFSETIRDYGYKDVSGTAHRISIDDTEQFLYYPIPPKAIVKSAVKPFTEKFPSTDPGFNFYRA